MKKFFSFFLVVLLIAMFCIPQATGESDKVLVNMQIGNKTSYVNGLPVSLDVPPQIINGRTLVPIRFVSENLGADVQWDGNTKTVTITMDSVSYLNNQVLLLQSKNASLEKENATLKAENSSLKSQIEILKDKILPALSEQPDKAEFQKYFSELGLGRLPPGGKMPADLQKNVTSFAVGDLITLYGNIIQDQECQPRYAIYDVQAKKIIKEGGFPNPVKYGFGSTEVLDIPLGKYEYKVYVGDVLVAIFPFEVR